MRARLELDSKVSMLSLQTSASEHDSPMFGNVGFILLRLLGGDQTVVPPPHSPFFIRPFAQATHSGVSMSLSMKWEYPGDIIFHILNYLEKH